MTRPHTDTYSITFLCLGVKRGLHNEMNATNTSHSCDEHYKRSSGNVSVEFRIIYFPVMVFFIFFYFEQLKLLLMSACVLVAEQRSVGAHFSQRLGCGTASTSGI